MELWVCQFGCFLTATGHKHTKPVQSKALYSYTGPGSVHHTILIQESEHSLRLLSIDSRERSTVQFILLSFFFWIIKVFPELQPTPHNNCKILLNGLFGVAPELWTQNSQACELKNKYNTSICKDIKLKCYKLFVCVLRVTPAAAPTEEEGCCGTGCI